MQLINEFNSIRQWAYDKGILTKGDAKTQTIKLQEEVGELASAVLKENQDDIKDAIGDCIVVLTSLSYLAGLSIEDCINSAYNVIKNRTGKIQNNNFVKDDE